MLFSPKTATEKMPRQIEPYGDKKKNLVISTLGITLKIITIII